LFFSLSFRYHRDLHSFPTRRSSDLLKTFTFKKQYPNFLFPGKSQFLDSGVNPDPVKAERIVSTFNPFTYFSAAKKIKQSGADVLDRKSTRLNSSHVKISYAVFCLKK